jgi:hypothetical protein
LDIFVVENNLGDLIGKHEQFVDNVRGYLIQNDA